MSKPKYTFEDFVRDARAVHGDTYDYSQGVYLAKDKDIKIICPIHGAFMQRVRYHLEGHGCPHKDCKQNKREATNLERYGTANPMQVDVFREKHDETCIERYGAATPLANQEVREKIISTMEERYGGRSAMCSEAVRAKVSGIRMKSVSDRKPVIANDGRADYSVMRTRNDLYILLVNEFGIQDVARDCDGFDFYVKSRDLYIGVGNCTESSGKAQENGYKYIGFRDAELRDAAVWFALGCPDSYDYDGQYTWLPERRITGYTPKCRLMSTPDSLSRWAKHYQFREFYKREVAMWDENANYRGIPLQMYLYWNRLKYIGKKPAELSDIEIVRGFKIAGILPGYSEFNVSMMDQVVSRYGIKSVYDPCAGWGERELYCYLKGIAYQGNDINSGLADGYVSMESELGMKDQSFGITDSSVYQDSRWYDAVITCPPYGNTEIYSEYGAENLSDKIFLLWWQQVVRHTNSRYFCFQINQKYKEAMGKIVKDCGFKFLEELSGGSSRVSHFNRKQDGVILKKEYESMLVYERI